MKKTIAACGLALLALATTLAPMRVFAHGGEEHGEEHSEESRPAAGPALAPPVGSESPARLADGSVFLPKASQILLEVRTVQASPADVAQTVELNGRVKADPSAGGQVQAPQMGRVLPAGRGLPVLGQTVKAGQVLAWLEPVVDSVERGAQQARIAAIDSELVLAERKVQRYAQLEGSIPQKEIDAARAQLQSLQQQRKALQGGIGRLPLAAPASGVLSNVAVVAGQVVDARDIVFTIVDPQRLVVEALAYDPRLIGNIASASGAIAGGSGVKLALLGSGLELREQAIPVLFRVLPPAPSLVIGQPMKVLAQLKQTRRGVRLPASALVRSAGGETVVWLHTAAERFAPRKVRAQSVDAESVVVTEGLEGTERVVVQGVATLAQVR